MKSVVFLHNFLILYQQSKERLSPANCLSAGMDPRGPLPPGVSMMPTQKQRVPPPPGEDNREVRRTPQSVFISWNTETTLTSQPSKHRPSLIFTG